MFAGEVIMNGAREHGVKNELEMYTQTNVRKETPIVRAQQKQQNNETWL